MKMQDKEKLIQIIYEKCKKIENKLIDMRRELHI